MRLLNVILIVILLLGSQIDAVASNKCPSSIDSKVKDCSALCASARPNGYQERGSIEGTSTSTATTIFATQSMNRCICIYDKGNQGGDDIPSDFVTCEYLITIQKPTDKVSFVKTALPNQPIKNLIGVVTFQPSSSNNPLLQTASSAIANTYYKTIHYFVSYYALLLLTIIFAGTLFIFGTSNFTQILRSPQGFWSLMTSTDFKSKSAQVILAVVFFGLPVNIETVYIDNVQGNNNQQSNEFRKLLKEDNATALCQNEYEEIRKAKQKYDECVEKDAEFRQLRDIANDKEEVDLIEDSSNVCDMEYSHYMTVYQTQNEACQNRINQNRNDENVIFVANDNTTNTTIVRRSIREGLQIPFATNVVAGFINFGVSASEKIAKWSSEAVKNYIYHQTVNSTINATSSLARLERRIVSQNPTFNAEFKVKLAGCGDASQFDSCDKIRETLYRSNTTFTSAYCREALYMAGAMCYRQETFKATLKEITKELETQAINKLKNRLSSAFGEIDKNYSFLSPALLPIVAVTHPFANMQSSKSGDISIYKIDEYRSNEIRDSSETTTPASSKEPTKGVSILTSIKDLWTIVSGKGTDVADIEATAEAEMSKLMVNELGLANKIAYFHGYAVVLLSIPPGSQIKESIETYLNKISYIPEAIGRGAGQIAGKVIETIAGKMLKIPPASVSKAMDNTVLKVLTFLAGEKSLGLISYFVSSYVAVALAELILFLLPFLAITIGGVIRFIHFLYEIAKLMITLPFYALPVATRKTEGVFFFFGDLVKLSVYPILMAASVSFAIFFALTFQYFIFEMPLSLILSQITPSSYTALFIFGALTAILQIGSTITMTYYLFKITMNFPDYIVQSVSRILQTTAPSREYQSFGEATFEKFKTVGMAKI